MTQAGLSRITRKGYKIERCSQKVIQCCFDFSMTGVEAFLREAGTPKTIQPIKTIWGRRHYRRGGLMVWAGISIGRRPDTHIIRNENLWEGMHIRSRDPMLYFTF
ncbi:hypothetical protein TNCV_3097881 [Trichonephila clavipes]|nr:hypothetical protein TNCV_3097881 [Trichonephila clavipes]